MREIKFRGKRVDNGEWINGFIKKNGSEWWILNETTDWHVSVPMGFITQHKYKIIPSTIGQFTGLRDKNGTEIYEGDVLSRKEWGMGGPHDPEERCEVQYLDYYIKEGEHSGHFNIELWSEWCEVIGNIHDNPELLEVPNKEAPAHD